jgi:Family of unknown function (DUF5923)
MSSCFGFRKPQAEEREPLLPVYRDDTELQRELHSKLHSYQMIRALSKGFMPSNEQVIVNLRTLLAADLLNPNNPNLSDSGRLLIKHTKLWLQQFIELLQHKNNEDQIEDFVWFLAKSRISIDTEDIARRASKAKAKADTVAGNYPEHDSTLFVLGKSFGRPSRRTAAESTQFHPHLSSLTHLGLSHKSEASMSHPHEIQLP